MATNITYTLKLDSSGAVASVDKVTKSFTELDTVQQKFAKNAGKIATKELDKYITDLRKIKEILGTMKPSFDLGKMAAQTTAQINKASKLLEQRLQQIQAKQIARMQSGFGLFTRIEATLASRTPKERKSDTTAAQAQYKAKLALDAKAAADLATQQAAKFKQQQIASANSANILAKLQANINTQSANFHKQQAIQQAQASANQLKQAQANSKAILAQLQANITAQAAANKLANQQAATAARQATQQAIAQAKLSSQQITQASKSALTIVPRSIKAPNVGATTPISQVAANPTNFINSLGTQTVNTTAQLTAMQNALHGLITQLVAIPAGVLSPTALAASANAINLLNNATHTLTVNLGQLQAASMGIASIINIFNTLHQATTLAWQGYQNLLTVIQDYRRGVSQAQLDTLNNVNAIKAEIEERNRLRKAYNDLSPALKQAAAERQKELNLNRLLTEGYAKYVAQRDAAPATQAGISYVQRLTSAWLAYQTQVQAAMQVAVAQGNAAVRAYEQQLKALERLQAKGSSYMAGKQVGFERSGTLNQMKASGASTDAVQGQKLRFQLEDIGKAYDKLVQKFQTKLLDPKLDQASLARMRAGFLAGEVALLKQRDAAQKALGEIEKLTKGVHKLDQVHKPFLERIFDLVVGYKLINAAVNTFTNAMRSVPEAGLQFETTYATLKAVFSVTTKVNQELKFLDELAQSAGISIDTLRSSFVDFAASAKFSGEKVENIQEIFANISKAGMVLHLPADKMKSAFTALNQMYAKNQVMMEELKRQLGNQLPAAVNIFALSMGKTTRQLMDDMKKGLVVPKETILNFSRTYAAMFADPASLEYASQGVNAHIQRMSTAWTNFATKVYETSKGGIKGGLSIATSAIDMLTNHMEALKNITIVTMSVMGVGLVSHLGKATIALMATRNAAIASAGAMSALTGAAATAGSVGAWATISTFFKGIGASIMALSPWVKIVAGIGLAVMALKDFEVGTTVVQSSLGATDSKAISMQESITIGDMVIASWDTLIEKGQKFLNIQKEAETNADKASPKEAKNSLLPWALGKTASMLPTGSAGGKLLNTGYNLMYANTVQAKQKQSLAEEATRQTEYLNERVKETLLAGTSGTVDETMAGMTKSVTTALGRIEADFNRTKQQIQGSADVKSSQLQLEITKTVVAEKQGSITAYESKKRQLSLQQQISFLQLDVLKKEKAALEDKARKEEAISQSRLDDSVEARKYNDAYLKLGLMQKFKQEMPQALVESKAFKTSAEAGTALVAGTISQDTLNQAREQYNATHLDHGFKKIEDVSEKAITEATKNTVETWKVYEQAMDAHKAMTMRVAEGVEETNTKTETQTEVLNRIADSVATKTTSIAESTTTSVAGALYDKFATASKPLGSSQWDSVISNLASKYPTVDPNLVKAIIKQESGGNPNAVSSAGAVGVGQFMLETARRFGITDRKDPLQSIEGIYKYQTVLLEKFNNNIPLALAGYNAGENRKSLEQGRIPNIPETQNYVKSIMGMYMPSKAAIKSGITKPEDATAKTLADIEAQKPKIEVETNKISGEILSGTQELVDIAFENTKATLQNSFQQIKTQKDLELAKVENTAIPLSDKQRLAKTSAIDTEFAPKLTSKIDELVKNAKEEITRTADTAKVSTLESDILNLTKERAGIEAEVLKDKATMELSKILPLQDALARRQFEIQKSLEESLGIYNEKTILQQQDLNNEELIKLVYQEKLRLADKNSGLTAEEVAKNTELLSIMDKQVKQLSQVELMKAKIAQAEEKASTFQAYSDAAAANAPINQASKMGVSGNFIGAMATEETARLNYDKKQANFEAQKVAYGNAQKGKEGTNEWYKLQTQIEQTTTAMNELALAKDAVINQATADTMNSIGDRFVGWANGAETVKDAFRGIAIDFAKMVQEILMNELKLAAVKGIMSLISGGIGGAATGGGIGSTGATSAIGIAGFATGGGVRGTGTGTSDSIPSVVPVGSYVLNAKASAKAKKARLIKLSHGEVVISPEQVAQLGLDNLNTMNTQGYATGGLVGGTATSSSAKPTGKNSNVYHINVAVPEGTSNPQQFGKDTGVEIYKAIAREEAKKELNRYNKMKAGGR